MGRVPIPLADRRWEGEATFRVLSYYFSLRWSWAEGGALACRVLDRFAVPPDPSEDRNPPTPGMPARYSLVARGRGRDRTYELYYGDGLMAGSPEPSNVLDAFFWNVNAEAIRRTGDFVLIHAGAVATTDGAGVLILGGSGSGKTTLTAALVRDGFGYLSDDVAPIDPVTRRLYPYPKALSVKTGAIDLVPERSGVDGSELLKAQRYLLPDDLRPGCVAGACEVGYVIAHRRVPGAETTIETITPATGVVELGRNGLNLHVYGGRAITVLTDVARGARHFALTAGSLDGARRAVARVTSSRRSA